MYRINSTAGSSPSSSSTVATSSRGLGREKLCDVTFTVKNTFIDDLADDESGDENGTSITLAKSITSAPAAIQVAREEAQVMQLATPKLPQWRMVPVLISWPTMFRPKHHVEVTPVDVVPLEIRQPEPSEGSQHHGIRECKPCAWFWRPQGCSNGPACRHCHLCSADESKNRKKQKADRMRSNGYRSRGHTW